MASKLASITFSRLFSSNPSLTKVGIIGVPFNKGQKLNGVAYGPNAIRNGGLIENIKEFNEHVNILDYGDVIESDGTLLNGENVPKNMGNFAIFADTMKRLSDKVYEVLNDGRICWTLGGDHSIAFGEYILRWKPNCFHLFFYFYFDAYFVFDYCLP